MSFRGEKLGTAAQPVETFDKKTKVINKAGKAVCKIHAAHEEQGTGALYRVVHNTSRERFFDYDLQSHPAYKRTLRDEADRISLSK